MKLSRWAAVLLVAAGCSGPMKTPIGPTPNPTPNPSPNTAPRITAIAASTRRLEVGNPVTLTATVADDETAVDQLRYEWTVNGGTLSGTGRVVQWIAPVGLPTPATFTISLTVIEDYRAGSQVLQNRATAQSPGIIVEDTVSILRGLAEKFLDNFADSTVTPETCLQDFTEATSDCAKGKRSELSDITDNRATRTILSHRVVVTAVKPDQAKLNAQVLASCNFTSIVKATNALEYANGTCDLKLIYASDRWWLCKSSFHGASSLGLLFTL